ncbi:efflux RND transporter periplasmic adaptor subunit [Motilimonas sp. E26]|uniref:efflux RND transporter periplasmic adaptor subunit n=1 Tax=Motilimonas sp. E26 TaxID=2865674 RepID=UPI001E654E74|nr:efflux RND transporter periplasmic adaptor subunit [Motilimonas sp. E26]MCE0558953.1 efflux RND transporter periplasmic adaptor subunit [Motilimonas sp. E26]
MKNSKLMPLIGSVLLLGIAITVVVLLEPVPAEPSARVEPHLPVSVIQVTPAPYRPKLTLTGHTVARWQTQLKAQTNAQVTRLDTALEPGTLVKKGQILAELDTLQLESERANALSEIKQAELLLQQQQHEQTVALKMLAGKRSSEFARKIPQIAAAKAQLAQAKQLLNSIEQKIRDSQIRAPFDAIILQRFISPQQFLDVGEPLFELAASDSLDVVLPVAEQHWQLIHASFGQPDIKVIDRQYQQWPAKVRFVAPQVDQTTKQRQVVLAINKPFQQSSRLLPNQPVTIEVTLPAFPLATKLPISALTPDGLIWQINKNNTLQQTDVRILETTPDHVWVTFPSNDQQQNAKTIAVYPLTSMLEGVKVKPIPFAEPTTTAAKVHFLTTLGAQR